MLSAVTSLFTPTIGGRDTVGVMMARGTTELSALACSSRIARASNGSVILTSFGTAGPSVAALALDDRTRSLHETIEIRLSELRHLRRDHHRTVRLVRVVRKIILMVRLSRVVRRQR